MLLSQEGMVSDCFGGKGGQGLPPKFGGVQSSRCPRAASLAPDRLHYEG